MSHPDPVLQRCRDMHAYGSTQGRHPQDTRYFPCGTSTYLILGCISNQALSVGEGHIAGCGPVALVVGDNLYSVILPDAHAAAYQTLIMSHEGQRMALAVEGVGRVWNLLRQQLGTERMPS